MDERVKDLLNRGREHYQKREFEKAEPLLAQVAEAQSTFADVHNMLGVMAHERGEFAAAERHFEKATAINPNYTEALLNLAVTYNDQAKYEAARRVYQQIRGARERTIDNIDPYAKGKIANMHANVATAYEEAGMPDEAMHEMEKAVALCPTFSDLRTKLGVLYRDNGRLEQAKEQFVAARDANPKYVHARVLLGVTLLSLNDVEGACDEWRAVLKVEPDNKSAQMYLRMVETSPRSMRPPTP